MTPIKNHIQELPQSNFDKARLREYQLKAKTYIYKAWDSVDNVMFQMPTGTGKTVMFASIINELDGWSRIHGARQLRILIIAHREELIEQIAHHLKRYLISFGIIKGGIKPDYDVPVQIGSVQTVTHKSRKDKMISLDFDYIIIDEAHHSVAESYKKLWGYYPKSKKLGVTATPCRLDHHGFSELFDTLILTPPVETFIRHGWLSPYSYYSIKETSELYNSLDTIRTRAGDYDLNDLEEHIDTQRIRAQLFQSYHKYAAGKKGIVYAINVSHALHICSEYRKHGVRIEEIDSDTPSRDRQELIRKFKTGEIDVIVNVNIFSEGFDCPDIEFIQLARPTKSLVMYLQQVGRGLRITQDKTHCIILDNVGMYLKFGLPHIQHDWQKYFVGNVDDVTRKKAEKNSNKKNQSDPDEGSEEMEQILSAQIPNTQDAISADNAATPMPPIQGRVESKVLSLEKGKNFNQILNGFSNMHDSSRFFWLLSLIDVAGKPLKRIDGAFYTEMADLMISHAWQLVKKDKITFASVDKMPGIVKNLNSRLHLSPELTSKQIFQYVSQTWDSSRLLKERILESVPYTFLSPWIKYRSKPQMVSDSHQKWCPYKLCMVDKRYCIQFNEGWKDFLCLNANELRRFVINKLSDHLLHFNDLQKEELHQLIENSI